MEPRGCNRWQLVANAKPQKPRTSRKTLPWVATGCGKNLGCAWICSPLRPRVRLRGWGCASELEPDVVLGEAGRRRARRDDVAQLRQLELEVERIAAGEPVEHRGHPPGEMFRAPDSPQAIRRVRV